MCNDHVQSGIAVLKGSFRMRVLPTAIQRLVNVRLSRASRRVMSSSRVVWVPSSSRLQCVNDLASARVGRGAAHELRMLMMYMLLHATRTKRTKLFFTPFLPAKGVKILSRDSYTFKVYWLKKAVRMKKGCACEHSKIRVEGCLTP